MDESDFALGLTVIKSDGLTATNTVKKVCDVKNNCNQSSKNKIDC